MYVRAASPIVFALLISACGSDGGPDRPRQGASGANSDAGLSDATTSSTDAMSSKPDAMVSLSGLPCDVSSFLATRCLACHSDPPRGAPFPLVSFEVLTLTDPGQTQTRAQRALAALEDGFMPPTGPLTASEYEPFRAWVAAGTPRGSCAAPALIADAGAVQPTVCSSGKRWTDGDEGDEKMHPGRACITCHGMRLTPNQPQFTIAGTVYPSKHEPDDCDGEGDSDIRINIRGADGQLLTLRPNSAGNFFSEAPLQKPFTVEITYDGRSVRMPAAQTSGDCNSCHTEQGANGALGRIRLP